MNKVFGTEILSGLDLKQFGILPKSLSTKYIGLEDINDLWKNIPTYISICPFCNTENKWRTTGILPLYIECEKCHQKFKD